ncbi:35404_t:CDS:2 [Racocetra persica]|uniref:35404_t:CDS:1 n=1 Tax=Racocetra persica TaxID=160502 RepID=A0ACA9NWX3_9GLOM|nr:35404_t:CDS:2 [Racocetra persica]
MTTNRWYSTSTTLSDGTVFILGGSIKSIAVNEAKFNNPTFEFFPKNKKNPGPQHFQFLVDTLPFNLYPIVHLLPGPKDQTQLFIFANQDSIIYDWTTNKVIKKLPKLPGGPRSYPLTGTSVMLPLRPEDNYKAQILVCGGNTKMDVKNKATNSCGKIDLSLKNPTWEMDDFGGFERVMPDSVLLADGKVLFLNGAGIGIAGYTRKGNVLQADDAVLTPVLYDDNKPLGKRFSKLDPSTIPRVYHSVATLLPNGKVFVAGSSPQASIITKGVKFPTDPPYLSSDVSRGTITSVKNSSDINKKPINVSYGETVEVTVELSGTSQKFTAAVVHYGFVTHSVHMSQRYVVCEVQNVKPVNKGYTMSVIMPPNGNIIAPGPSYLHINNKGVPLSSAVHILLN